MGGRGGGWWVGGYEHKSRQIFLYKTHWHDLFYRTVRSHENIPDGIKIEGIVALTIKGR